MSNLQELLRQITPEQLAFYNEHVEVKIEQTKWQKTTLTTDGAEESGGSEFGMDTNWIRVVACGIDFGASEWDYEDAHAEILEAFIDGNFIFREIQKRLHAL